MLLRVEKDVYDLIEEASTRIDILAEETRLQFITGGPGQVLSYKAKLDDAIRYIAAGYPTDTAGYLWITTEATAMSESVAIVADAVVAAAARWELAGSAIEAERIVAKFAAREATTTLDVYTIEKEFIETMSAF
jgi:hypothetical protein